VDSTADRTSLVAGELSTLAGERYYAIRNVDQMPPFFISLVSNGDHWMFISSTGGLTAGRVSPDTALFPYVTVDKVHESWTHTGSTTIVRMKRGDVDLRWEPFHRAHDDRYSLTRNLYKNVLGNKLCFEELNHDLDLAFRYWWLTSDRYGFIRRCELENLADHPQQVELVDGFRNILPAGTPRFAQTNTSNLVDAYKWTEVHDRQDLALYTLYSGITDRAEPSESLRANTVFCLGLPEREVFLSERQLWQSIFSGTPRSQRHQRGIRGDYLVRAPLELDPRDVERWQLIANVEQTQPDVVSLLEELEQPEAVAARIDRSIERGTDVLARMMASADAFQDTSLEVECVHHYANVLFNVLRGGIFDNQYLIRARYFRDTLESFSTRVFLRNRELLDALPDEVDYRELLRQVEASGDLQLERLAREYLPIRFGRRHGDPSRPWNHFVIELEDERGDELLAYQGNWRDVFQNWQALTFSFPEFLESVIAKFVNASTADGYNPYRISNEGIDWEVEDPDDPWSYIGYWGDHQIIYLLRFLELSQSFHPDRLEALFDRRVFAYANVPYRIKPFESLVDDAKNTVVYDEALAARIEARVDETGADGKLLLDEDGEVYRVNLLEKLLVPLLAKLGNFVLGGGIWLNTQRPEWNDANNALVGHGLSMVTLYYIRRYVVFLDRALEGLSGDIEVSDEVAVWLRETATALQGVRPQLAGNSVDTRMRSELLEALGGAASRYRESIYAHEGFSGVARVTVEEVRALLADVAAAADYSIALNERNDGLYHAYNILHRKGDLIDLERLDPMLEGQVAALSSGAISPRGSVRVLESLFESELFSPDVRTFILYPDRRLPRFLDKNRVPPGRVETISGVERVLDLGDSSLLMQDAAGSYRFNADLRNANDLRARLDELEEELGYSVRALREPLLELYEDVFHHRAFTGRAGTMFGFEGLGSVYWHMVSKLLLATQEAFFDGLDAGTDSSVLRDLGRLYYRIREGLGFNKTPAEYGAFPADPYSHTPKHAGAQQPGMTGQVKEEILTRFGELGIRVRNGKVCFLPALLRRREFHSEPSTFRFLDTSGSWQRLAVPAGSLAFTWCQIPFVYSMDGAQTAAVRVVHDDGNEQSFDEPFLPTDLAAEVFSRSGRIQRIEVRVDVERIFGD